MSEAFERDQVDEDKLDLAIRKQIQSVALHHLVDANLDGVSAFRFKSAGTLNASLTRENPPDTAQIILDPNHARRLGEEDGLLLFVKDQEVKNSAGVIDLSEHLLENDNEVREASLAAIRRLKEFMLPATFEFFEANVAKVQSEDESVRLSAALRIYDVLNRDFLLNIAGLRKCCEFQFDEYDKYYRRVFRPSIQALNSFAPPTIRPIEQSKDLEEWAQRWREVGIEEALGEMNEKCGYLPPTIQTCPTLLVDRSKVETEWDTVWRIATTSSNCKLQFHATMLLLTNLQAISDVQIKEFEGIVLEQLKTARRSKPSSEEGEEKLSKWDALYELARHYLAHLESTVPAVDSTVTVSYAWWMAEKVVSEFFFYYTSPLSLMERIVSEELDLSTFKWSFSRTASTPSSARKDIIFTASIWSDSLLAKLVDCSEELSSKTSPEFMEQLFHSVNDAMILNRFNLPEVESKTYLVDDVPIEKIRKIGESRGEEESKALQGLCDASELINRMDGVNKLLSDFTNEKEQVGFYVGFALQARQFAGRDAGSAPVDSFEIQYGQSKLF